MPTERRPFSAIQFGETTNIPNPDLVAEAARLAFAPGVMFLRAPYRLTGEERAAIPSDVWAVVFAATGSDQGLFVKPDETFLCLSESFVWNDRLYIEALVNERTGVLWISLPGAVVPVL